MTTSLWHTQHPTSLNNAATVVDEGLISIEKIEIDPDQRFHKLHEETVECLFKSMAVSGQITPIVISRKQAVGGGYRLIAGHHRIEAAKRLGQTEIKASVLPYLDADEAALAEIDDNLVRGELSVVERALHLSKSKELYEKMHSEELEAALQVQRKRASDLGNAQIVANIAATGIRSPGIVIEPREVEVREDKPPQIKTWQAQKVAETGISKALLNDAVLAARTIPDIGRIAHTSLDKEHELKAAVKLSKEAPELVEVEIAKAEAGDKTASFVRVEAELKKVQLNPKTERLLVTLLYHMKNSETDAGRQIVFDRVREVFEHPEGNPFDVSQRKAHDEIRGLAKERK